MKKRWTTKDFPIGIYQLNHDQSVNFQMNRFFNWSNDKVLLEQMKALDKINQTYPSLINDFKKLGEKSVEEGQILRAAMYFRAAEFYLPETDPSKQQLRKKFISLNNKFYDIDEKQHFLIPYHDGKLSAYRLTSKNSRGTILFINGFDGYIEELTRMMLVYQDAGYDVIYFDGPGQGYALEENKMPMTSEWEEPVKGILDYFNVDDITAIGMSLGGNLVLHAAAFEKRIKRTVCFDVLPSLFNCITRQLPETIKNQISSSIAKNENVESINAALNRLMEKSLMLQWAIQQGMHVLGASTPYDFIKQSLDYDSSKISELVDQDILLLAGQDDHYVALDQLPLQISTLSNAHSVTARIFTAKESASNHCQLGNIGLAISTILNWLDQI
ncbi:alpha/beta hydrolase [Liquorilactobacillus mali]|uniref:alpha/beta hydrolase n=1 Tax=Liquorilactobacillus mali TaxID=1618 RepID=UPI00234FD241|nr:alpha/beta hydrolase [Liquorilactobacillus mali]MDC7952236.1 alpha/beta fold hydrolase [Liquorilactobacillus mali]